MWQTALHTRSLHTRRACIHPPRLTPPRADLLSLVHIHATHAGEPTRLRVSRPAGETL